MALLATLRVSELSTSSAPDRTCFSSSTPSFFSLPVEVIYRASLLFHLSLSPSSVSSSLSPFIVGVVASLRFALAWALLYVLVWSGASRLSREASWEEDHDYDMR